MYITDRHTSDKVSSNGEGIPSSYTNEVKSISIKVLIVLCSQTLPYMRYGSGM